MARIDPKKTWRIVEARLRTETNPRHRRLLEVVLAHMKAEAALDVDGLMATLAPDPVYHAWGTDDPFYSPVGREAVRSFYTAFAASGAHRLEFDVDRLVVDDGAVFTEGTMRIVYPGAILEVLGHRVDDANAFYLYEARMAVVWPMDEDGLIIGEDSYTGGDGFAGIASRKIDLADVAPLASPR
jgi:hypothetical protein